MPDLDRLMSTGETVQHATRQHWMALLIDTLGSLIALLLLTSGALWAAEARGLSAPLVSVLLAASLVPIFLILRDIWRWWIKRYVVTTRRIMEIEGILTRTVRDSNLDKVNDITLRQSLPGRMLDYGDLEVITGSDAGINRLEHLAAPVLFKRVILDNKEDFDTIARLRAMGAGQPEEPFPGGVS